jgi:nuclease S1
VSIRLGPIRNWTSQLGLGSIVKLRHCAALPGSPLGISQHRLAALANAALGNRPQSSGTSNTPRRWQAASSLPAPVREFEVCPARWAPSLGQYRSRVIFKPLPILAGALYLLASSSAFGWGRDGHRLIAELAYESRSPVARSKVDALLATEPGATFVSISTWADEVRTPSTGRWHYVNFDRGGSCSYVAQRDCPDGQCVVGAIERQTETIKTSKSLEDRLKALKWLVHLVGDVHQPLHSGFADDKGANLYQVQAFGRGGNLHSVWDSGLLTNWPGGLSTLATELRRGWTPDKGSLGNAADWASESCRIASSSGIYPDGRFVDDNYAARWRPVVLTRMQAGARRLTEILNDL